MKRNISKLVFPNKKINYFTISILLLGFICGCIFLVVLSQTDKESIITQITNYFNQINNNHNYNFKNTLLINYTYIILIFLLSLSIIGLILNIIIIYIKGFVTGFTLSSMILTYKIKGILSSFIYLIFGQLINLISIIFIGIYGFMFSIYLLKIIFRKKVESRGQLKKYIIMLLISIILTLISSLLEIYILPHIYKSIIKILI